MELVRTRKVKGKEYLIARTRFQGKVYEKSLGAKDGLTRAEIKRRLMLFIRSVESGELDAQKKSAKAVTFNSVVGQMLDDLERLRQWKTPKSKEAWKRSLCGYAAGAFGEKAVDKITRDDVLSLLEPLWFEKTETASRLRMRLEAFFDWAEAHDLRSGKNPAAWKGNIELFLPQRAKVRRVVHHEALSLEELRQAVAYCLSHPSPVSGLILFVAATACRVSEARLAEPSEIEGDTWVMPSQRRKDGKADPHRVPLSTLAVEALAMAGDGKYLFSATEGRPLALDSARLKLKAIIGRDVTMHGIRSSFRDWAAVSGIDFVAAEKALSHQVGTAVTQAYLREDLLEVRRPIMQRWADAISKTPTP